MTSSHSQKRRLSSKPPIASRVVGGGRPPPARAPPGRPRAPPGRTSLHVGAHQRTGPGYSAVVEIAASPGRIDPDDLVRRCGAEGHLTLELVGRHEVVAVEKLHPSALGGAEPDIARGARPSIFVDLDHGPVAAKIRRQLVSDNLDRVVGRAVVDHDQLQVRIGLGQEIVDRVQDPRLGVVGRHDDADESLEPIHDHTGFHVAFRGMIAWLIFKIPFVASLSGLAGAQGAGLASGLGGDHPELRFRPGCAKTRINQFRFEGWRLEE